jgi:hypothetical protein
MGSGLVCADKGQWLGIYMRALMSVWLINRAVELLGHTELFGYSGVSAE